MAEKNDYSQETHPFIAAEEDERLKNEALPATEEGKKQALLDLEKAREAGYSWVDAANKAAAYLKAQIAETEKKIKQAVNADLKKYQEKKLEILQARRQRLETLSSEDKGADDRDLNDSAYFKYDEDEAKKSVVGYKDAARAELLNDLSREITDQEVGVDIPKPQEEDLVPAQKEEKKKPEEAEIDEIPNPEDFATKIETETVKSEDKKEAAPVATEAASVPIFTTEAEEATPELSGAERPKKRIALVKAEKAVEEAARHMAEARLTRKSTLKKEKGWRKFKNVPRFIKSAAIGLWDYTFDAARRQHHYKKAKKEIESSKSLYIGEGDINRSAHLAGMQALVDRFASGYEELVHKEAGEESEMITDPEFNVAIKNLIKDYAGGGMSRDEFGQRRNTIIASRTEGKISEKEITDGLTYADNLFEIAEQARQSVGHGAGLEKLDLDFEIVAGKAKMGCRTEMQLSKAEKIIDKIQNNKVGKFLFQETIIVPLVYCLGRKAVQTVTMSKIAQAATLFGSAGAGAALTKKRLDIMQEKKRAQDMYEAASGKTEFDRENSPQRLELESMRYGTKKAAELSRDLEASLYVSRNVKEAKLKAMTPEQLKATFDVLAEIEARIKLSDQHKIDLISYSNPKRVEQERKELDLLRAQAKLDLLKLKQEKGWNYDYANVVQMQENALAEERTEKDNQFKKIKRAKSLKGAAVSGVAGLVLGATAQEVMATLPDWNVSLAGHEISFGGGRQSGLLESAIKHGKPEGEKLTALAALVEYIRGGHIGGKGEMISQAVTLQSGQEMQVQLPEGFSLADPDHNGQFDLMEGDKLWGQDAVTIAPDGQVDFSDALKGKGFTGHTNFVENAGAAGKVAAQDVESFMNSEWAKENATSIHHEDWFRNRLPKISDLNELKLHKGGTAEHPSLYTDSDGKEWIDYSVRRMAPDGSFSDRFSVDAQELMKSGKMKFFLYPSEEHQGQAFPMDVAADGKIRIDPESELGKMFFKKGAKGFEFMGRYGEVEYILGEENGVKQIIPLATMEGPGMPEMPPVGPTPIPIIERPPQDWELFPPIPMKREKALEPMVGKELLPPPYYYYGGFVSPELKKIFAERRSETLQKNPEAILDHYEEAEKYINTFPPEYRQELDQLMGQAGKMSRENRLSICIPAAGHQEGKNIYESLKNYTYQNVNPEQYEIVLFVNHPDQDLQGKKIAPDATLDEIERFQKDFPEMNVRVMYSVLPREKAKIGLIRKMLNDSTLLRHHERGKEVPDLIMVSNDADNRGVAPEYVENFLKKFDKNPKLDGMVGQLDWDPESYTKYPAVHIGTRVFQYLGVLDRHHGAPVVSSGANFAFRSSMYAGIGGYMHELPGGEDTALGQAISEARQSEKTLGYAGAKVSRLFTSSRRAVKVLREGLAPVEQWDGNFSAFEDEVRKLELGQGEEIDYDNPEAVEKLKQQLEYIINRTFDYYKRYGGERPKDLPDYKKTLGWLGIKYKLDEKGDVVITDMSRLAKDLKTYKEEGILIRDAKSGKKEAAEQLKGVRVKRKESSSKQQQEVEQKAEQEMQKFYSTDHLDLEIKQKAADIDVETVSQDQETIGDYILAKDFKLYDEKKSKIFRAVKHGEKDRPLVAKEVATAEIEKESRLRNVPQNFESVEQYLASKNFVHPNVIMPIEKLTKDDQTIRFYEASDIDLEQYLADHKKLPVKQALSLMIRVCDGIRAVHKENVAYVDCAPLNIVLTKDSAKIIDLDEASIDISGAGKFQRGKSGVNRFALAPEMFSEKPIFDKTVDVYSACSTLYRMIAGDWPYNLDKETADLPYAERMARYRKAHQTGDIKFPDTMPEKLQRVIKKGMSPSPSARYQSMNELLVALLDAHESLGN